MKRLGLLLIFAAACGGSGYETGDASLSGTPKMVRSASAKPFVSDGKMGWTIEFFTDGKGTDCMSEDATVVASLGIYTNQPDDGNGAVLTTGDIPIVSMSPPNVAGSAAANMSADGVSGITGIVTLTDFYKDHVDGMVGAGGTAAGNQIALNGMFHAPACGAP